MERGTFGVLMSTERNVKTMNSAKTLSQCTDNVKAALLAYKEPDNRAAATALRDAIRSCYIHIDAKEKVTCSLAVRRIGEYCRHATTHTQLMDRLTAMCKALDIDTSCIRIEPYTPDAVAKSISRIRHLKDWEALGELELALRDYRTKWCNDERIRTACTNGLETVKHYKRGLLHAKAFRSGMLVMCKQLCIDEACIPDIFTEKEVRI